MPLTNRELASLILFGLLALFVFAQPSRRQTLAALQRIASSATKPKVLFPILLYTIWVTAAVAIASTIGIWTRDLIKPTLLWIVGSGLALFVSGINEGPGFFRKAAGKVVAVSVGVEFIAALHSFSLWIELPAQALAVILTGVAAVADRNPSHAPARQLAGTYLAIFGFSAVVWSMVQLASEWDGLNRAALARELLLPVWLMPVALVFVYAAAIAAAYESLFIQMSFRSRERPLRSQKLAILFRAHVRLGSIRRLGGMDAMRIANTGSFCEAWREIGVIEIDERLRIAEEAAAKRRLVEFAGVPGTDESGRQLDQREFRETCAALRWLATCEMGHYRTRKAYRGDLLPIVESHFERDGLPDDHGINVCFHPGGQSWYAVRQTVSGWWFGIGAAGPPPDQWLYDGSSPPVGFPGEPEWDHFGSGAASINWD